ncbi:MAG: pyruvate kinase [Planctomycetota bacterium]
MKILATIGPACADPKVLCAMLEEGADAIRVNASHTDPGDVAKWVQLVRKASKRVGLDAAVMLDLQGIKRRIGDLASPIPVSMGDEVVFGRPGAGRIPLKLKTIREHLKVGGDLFLDDGFLRFQVTAISPTELRCVSVREGEITSRAGVNLPGIPVTARIPTTYDIKHIHAGLEAGVDLFALSFVRDAKDLRRCRKHAQGTPIVAKIERPEAVTNIDEVALASDGLLVARGDLAVEMKPEELPVLQKSLVAAANRARKPVIVATEMLASLVDSPRPTRAELTDVGNAVLDGADATMLSDETAIGHDPARAVRYMTRIISTVEGSIMKYNVQKYVVRRGKQTRPDWSLADAAVSVAAQINAKAIVAVTGSGRTAMLISAGRPSVPLYAFCAETTVRRRVSLMWGVNTALSKPSNDPDKVIRDCLNRLIRVKAIEPGELVVIAYGSPIWAKGTKTNTVRIATA